MSAEESAPSRSWDHGNERPTTLLLVRHGSTEHSLSGRFSGRNELALDRPGAEQAAAVAAYVSGLEPVDAVVSSPLGRACETADAIAVITGRRVVLDADLIEMDFGAWEGRTFAEAQQDWPAELDGWLASEHVAPPGGESFGQVEERVVRCLARLLDGYRGQRVVVVTHATPIRTLLRLALGAPHESIFRLHLDTGALSIIDYYRDGGSSVKIVNHSAARH